MAIRKSDVEVYRSGISSLMDAARQQTAAFYDPTTQVLQGSKMVVDTFKTAMDMKPKFDDFMEGIRSKKPIGPEGDAAIQSAVSLDNVTGPFDTEMIKKQLGSGYMEGVDYEMDAVTGQYKPVVDMGSFGTFGEVDMGVKAPKIDMNKFADQTDKIEGAFARVKSEDELAINLLGIQNAANFINNYQDKPYRYYGQDQIGPFRGPVATPEGKIDLLNLLDLPFGAVRYLAGPNNKEG